MMYSIWKLILPDAISGSYYVYSWIMSDSSGTDIAWIGSLNYENVRCHVSSRIIIRIVVVAIFDNKKNKNIINFVFDAILMHK